MAKGIVYCMRSIGTPGLVKIGKTKKLKSRMNDLKDGYKLVHLEISFAIETDDYDIKETILKNTFDYCCLKIDEKHSTELFAVDYNKVIDLMLCFDGKQVFPSIKEITKKELIQDIKDKEETKLIPNGVYTLDSRGVKASMKIDSGLITISKGSQISLEPINCFEKMRNKKIAPHYKKLIKSEYINNGVFVKDYYDFHSVSRASCVITASSNDGWKIWKNSNGEIIDIYRKKEESNE